MYVYPHTTHCQQQNSLNHPRVLHVSEWLNGVYSCGNEPLLDYGEDDIDNEDLEREGGIEGGGREGGRQTGGIKVEGG